MKKQEVSFAVLTDNGIVTRIGKSEILQPRVQFRGGSIKWYDGMMKAKDGEKGRKQEFRNRMEERK